MSSTLRAMGLETRRQEIVARYMRGEQQSAIAKSLGLTQQQISVDLHIIRAAWLTSAVRDFDAIKAEQLAKIDAAESAAWREFDRSREDVEVTIQEESDGRLRNSRRVETRVGDPRFLQTILNCIAKRCDLLGLDAPKRFTINWDALSDSQMERLARGEPVQSVLAHPIDPPAPEPLALLSSAYADTDG